MSLTTLDKTKPKIKPKMNNSVFIIITRQVWRTLGRRCSR